MRQYPFRHLFALVLVFAQPLPASGESIPAATGKKQDDKKYISCSITRFDRLNVAVFDEPELTVGGKRVEATGNISLTLIGEIPVVGLTILEAQAAIEMAYREGRFLRNPRVTITIDEYASRTVIVSGKINAPGRYEMPHDTAWTLKDFIIKAGGLQETARGTRVRITRMMPDGSLKVFEKDVESLIRAKSGASRAEAEFKLEPDDTVYVPERIF